MKSCSLDPVSGDVVKSTLDRRGLPETAGRSFWLQETPASALTVLTADLAVRWHVVNWLVPGGVAMENKVLKRVDQGFIWYCNTQ
jgi:hypothetical protein